MSLIAQYVEGDFPCAITKTEHGETLCGYVGVPPCHPWYGKGGLLEVDADVHGGLTWHAHEQPDHPVQIAYWERKTADYAEQHPGDTDGNWYASSLAWAKTHLGTSYPCTTGQDVWWLGFDCNHLWDQGYPKDEAYVRQELSSLVSQAAAAMNEESAS